MAHNPSDPKEIQGLRNIIESEVNQLAQEMRRDINRQIGPGYDPPEISTLRRLWLKVKWGFGDRTKRPRRWVAKHLYDFETHEDYW